MTTSTIMYYLICFYTFLEIYVFVYSQELKIRSYFEYYEQLAQINCTELEDGLMPSFQTEPVSNVIPMVQPVQATLSELDEAAEGLFAELQQELGLLDSVSTDSGFVDDSEHEFYYETAMESDVTMEFSHFETEEDEVEDCIHLSDLKYEEESEPTGYEAYASAKIADCLEGPQQWVVSVVGMEESYIHVSDGKRIWVNVGEKAQKLKNNDVLILDVIRTGNDVSVENLFLLETGLSEDYMIPDEEVYIMDERIAM